MHHDGQMSQSPLLGGKMSEKNTNRPTKQASIVTRLLGSCMALSPNETVYIWNNADRSCLSSAESSPSSLSNDPKIRFCNNNSSLSSSDASIERMKFHTTQRETEDGATKIYADSYLDSYRARVQSLHCPGKNSSALITCEMCANFMPVPFKLRQCPVSSGRPFG